MKSGKKLEKKSKKTLKKKKLSSNITTIILILIFLVGLSVMLYPTVSNYVNQRHQSKAIAAYDEKVSEMKPEDYTKYFEAAEKYNKKLAKNPSAFYNPDEIKGYEKILDISGTGIMGYITIKKLGVELPIYHGTGYFTDCGRTFERNQFSGWRRQYAQCYFCPPWSAERKAFYRPR